MRPPRGDIPAPPFLPATTWIGGDPGRMEALTARGPVLVHFIDFAQLNSVRALPYPVAWAGRYADAGLSVVGVHSPRFAFTAQEPAARAGLDRLDAGHPIAVDLNHAIWHDYGCEGWPSLFLWGRGGALRWFHFGEGEYEATELAIQEELRSTNGADSLPDPMAPLRPSDAPGAVVIAPSQEVLPGGSLEEPWRATEDSPAIELDYSAGGAYATVDGTGELVAVVDGSERSIEIEGGGLYELAEHRHHSDHELRIVPAGDVRVWSVSFAPGVPAEPQT